jgi:coiled-coil domain-containing protein 12
LKRDIAKKINRLERRTQKAVVELLRQRLEEEAEKEAAEDDLD